MRILFSCSIISIFTFYSSMPFAQTPDTSLSGGVNRAELAAALLRVEQCFYPLDLADSDMAAYNKAFDDASLLFFGGDFPKALEALHSLVLAWQPEYKTHPTMPYIASLRAQISPRVYALDSDVAPSLNLSEAYPLSGVPRPKTLRISMAPYSPGGAKAENLLTLGEVVLPENLTETASLPLPMPKEKLDAGLYTLYLSDAENNAQWLGATWAVVDTPLDATAAANKVLLESVKCESPELENAKAAVEVRNNLLTDAPTDQKSTDYVLDPMQIKRELETEIAALQKGENPFRQRKGDYWRVYKTSAGKIPARVFAPEALDFTKEVPLVIAFHGAGGDENMFMEAYGLGEIKKLSAEKKFLLLCPLTYPFAGWTAGATIKQMLEEVRRDYPVDAGRVYVLGHSMGGGATSAVVGAAPEIFAAAASLCGVGSPTGKAETFPPTLLIAAELDPLAKAERIEAAFETAKNAGLTVEYELKKNYGHTLVVGDILPVVITWLLKDR